MVKEYTISKWAGNFVSKDSLHAAHYSSIARQISEALLIALNFVYVYTYRFVLHDSTASRRVAKLFSLSSNIVPKNIWFCRSRLLSSNQENPRGYWVFDQPTLKITTPAASNACGGQRLRRNCTWNHPRPREWLLLPSPLRCSSLFPSFFSLSPEFLYL